MKKPLIETINLKKYFKTGDKWLHAVDGVNIKIEKGETLGVVGESGCGKSTLGRVILRLHEATDGEVLFEGENILKFNKKQVNAMRQDMQIIFQDPYSSLNPRLTVSEIIAEPIIVSKTLKDSNSIYKKVYKLMETVGLSSRMINLYPHELDGGRRQRIGIARALALNPRFIVCDEPVSALDVSIQAQVLNLLMDLQEEMELTYMFITHDLSVVKHISNQIAVMYLGQCVEVAPTDELFNRHMHPYTSALLNAIPHPNLSSRTHHKEVIKGEVTSPIDPKPGCRFANRCPNVKDVCRRGNIPLVEVLENHFVACSLLV